MPLYNVPRIKKLIRDLASAVDNAVAVEFDIRGSGDPFWVKLSKGSYAAVVEVSEVHAVNALSPSPTVDPVRDALAYAVHVLNVAREYCERHWGHQIQSATVLERTRMQKFASLLGKYDKGYRLIKVCTFSGQKLYLWYDSVNQDISQVDLLSG